MINGKEADTVGSAAIDTSEILQADHQPVIVLTGSVLDASTTVMRALLSVLGYRETEENPDMFVTCHAIVMAQQQLDTTGFGYSPYGRWENATTGVATYYEGTPVVDLFDARTHKMMFRGTGTDTVSEKG